MNGIDTGHKGLNESLDRLATEWREQNANRGHDPRDDQNDETRELLELVVEVLMNADRWEYPELSAAATATPATSEDSHVRLP